MEREEFVEHARVSGSDGRLIGKLVSIDHQSRPPSVVVRLETDMRLVRISFGQIDWARSSPGEVVATVADRELEQSRTSPQETASPAGMAEPSGMEHAGSFTIPLAEEELDVSTREVDQGRVIVRKRVETVPLDEAIEVSHDDVGINRVAMNREVDKAPPIRREGDTTIVPVVEEMLVVEKRLRLVEEVHITKRRVTEEARVQDELRREVLDIVTDPTPDGETGTTNP